MSIRDWRVKHKMVDPVRGEFRVSGSYHPRHQAASNFEDMLTGVVIADGVPPTPTEHMDRREMGYSNRVLPVLVDRADPTLSVVLWREVRPVDFQARAREAAQEQAQHIMSESAGEAVDTTAGGAGRWISGADPAHPTDPSVVVVDDLKDLPSWLSAAVSSALDGHGGAVDNVDVHLGALTGAVTRASGRAAQAVLISVSDVPAPAYALPGPTASLTDLCLQLTRADGSSYTAQTRMGFRSAERRGQLAVIGSSVPVYIDSTDETHVSIDLTRWG